MATTLGKVDLQPPEELESGLQKLDVMQDAVLTLQQKGLVPAGPPGNGYRGQMPLAITSLDDEHLGDLLNNLALWCAYIEEELSKADNERKAAKERVDFTEARVRLSIKSDESMKKLTVQDKNDIVMTDPRVVDARSRLLYHEAVYSLTKTILNSAQRDWETVSRRITQRGQDIERMRRENVVSSQPRPFRRQ